jgi:hypothetical protein
VLEEHGHYSLRLREGGQGLFVLSLPEPPDPDLAAR